MKFSIKLVAISVATTCMLIPQVSTATNGAWLIGFGAKSRSMGGTGVADNRGAMAAAFNPASMIDSGNRFDLGADLFMPPRAIKHESTRLGFTDEQSTTDIFLIPSMGATYEWNEKITVGFAFIGAGLQTEYDQSSDNSSCNRVNAGTVPGYLPGDCPPTIFNVLGTVAGPEAGVELIQMQMLPSIAYKINEQHSVGATLAIAASYFRAEGLEDFGEIGFTGDTGSSDPSFGLSGGHWDQSFGAGIRLGWLGKFQGDKLKVGVNYSSRVFMSEFGDYQFLFAEQGDFDIPESYQAGIAYDVTPAITVAFDIQRINWSDVKSIGNPGPSAADPDNLLPLCPQGSDQAPCLLGGDKGLGFGWKDQTVLKLGVDWQIDEKWNARAGWNYAKSPIRPDQVLFNMLAPATPEHHITFGVGYELSETYVLDGSLVYAFSNPINGPTAFGKGGAIVTGSNATIDMKQLSIGGALGIRF